MRVFQVSDKRFLLQLQHGEEVKAVLRDFAHKHDIGAGVFRGLGAAERSEMDFYHLPEQRHERLAVDEPTEVAVLLGNLTRGEDNEPIIHVHATLARCDGSTIGGHVEELVVGATLEIDLEVLPGTLSRQLDRAVGLRLQSSYDQR